MLVIFIYHPDKSLNERIEPRAAGFFPVTLIFPTFNFGTCATTFLLLLSLVHSFFRAYLRENRSRLEFILT
jgi:hypothetical protein